MQDQPPPKHCVDWISKKKEKKKDVNSQFSSRLLNPEDEFLKGGEHPAALPPVFGKRSLFAVVTKRNLGPFENPVSFMAVEQF